MTTLPSFRLPATPLATGLCLVEASAGTGKTFTIAGLFLRLILERDLSVREILVVTFTEAATEELRDRIRRTLVEAAAALGGASPAPVLAEILLPFRAQAGLMRARLERALRAFDEAPIFTIHSFCQRTLRDHAFECGALFDTELITDDSDLLQCVADDYWRRHFYGAPPLQVSVALRGKLSPDTFASWLRFQNRHPELRILSAVDGRPLDALAKELQEAFAAARAGWRAHREEIRALFLPAAPWAKSDHGSPIETSLWLEQIERGFGEAGPMPEALDGLRHFTPAALEENTRASKRTPRHEFFESCGDVTESGAHFITGLRLDFLPSARQALRQAKRERKLQSFDDLLTGLLAALRGGSGPALVAEVRRRYRAVLIDEFQDTDPVQWEISRTLFAGPGAKAGEWESGREGKREGGKAAEIFPDALRAGHFGTGGASSPALRAPSPPSDGGEGWGEEVHPRGEKLSVAASSLFLIGDPKQAIYGFRGADIFTYLDAARGAPDGYTLDQNWRSESGLVVALNTLFSAAASPFVFDAIAFQKVTAAGQADAEPLREDGGPTPPLRLWFMPREEGAREITKESAEAQLPGIVASEIVRLLGGSTTIGGRPLSPRDIAVLVPENRQAALMQEALRRVSVPAVLHTEESVFASREARELERVLAALAQPGHERAVRAALATDLLGVTGAGLDALAGDEAAWQLRLERVREHHDRWLKLGFMPMFRHWLQAEAVRQRLLALEDGERRLTNLLHLAEALHAAAQKHRFGPAPLARWLAERVSSPEGGREEHQLRLERDDEAVRLVTIHKSKGLEYPVVFCPFSWKSSELKRGGEEQVLFHDVSGAASQLVLDLGSPHHDEHRRLAFREKLAENLRLLYVALTRAKHRCYFVWGAFKNAGTSAPAWLFHRPPVLGQDWQAALTAHFKPLTDEAMLADLEALAETARLAQAAGARGAEEPPHPRPAAPPIQVGPPPRATSGRHQSSAEPGVEPAARTFDGKISTDWRIASFSGLVADAPDELPDHDAETPAAAPAPEPAEARGIFAFPRGTRAGTCLHQVFEELDFARTDDAELRRIVESKLRQNGIVPDEFAAAVIENVRHTLAVPLDGARRDFTLSRVTRHDRLTELEFFMPVQQLTPALLRHGLAPAGEDVAARLDALGFQPSRGFLKGFIDLVFQFDGRFYVVDWKSNWLGNRVEDYGPDALRSEMVGRFYLLQSHLYVVALHEYLRLRLPGYDYDTHFGGVRYVFLRGVDPGRPEFGVYRDRPAAKTIEGLAALLRGPGVKGDR